MTNNDQSKQNNQFILSFSGGKDSTLALYHALKKGQVIGLIMMLSDEGEYSRSHGVPISITQAQANALDLPILSASSSWSDYEENYLNLLAKAKNLGAELLITGDIDIPEHASWHEQIVQKAGLELYMPLWNRSRKEIVEEIIELGFVAMIVSVNLAMGMKTSDLGKILTKDVVNDLTQRGIDICGESGEFHTLVLDGPIFKMPIKVVSSGIRTNDTYAFLNITSLHSIQPLKGV